MDNKRLQMLYIREKELKEDELNIQHLLKMVREEMHKMQVEQLQWESLGMPVSEVDSVDENTASTSSIQLMSDSEVNSQAVNLDVPILNELFMHSNKREPLDEVEQEEEEEEEDESEDGGDPDTENENSDEDLLSFL